MTRERGEQAVSEDERERLLKTATFAKEQGWIVLYREQADTILRLLADRARLFAENAALQKNVVDCGSLKCPFEERADAAEARVQALTEKCHAFRSWLDSAKREIGGEAAGTVIGVVDKLEFPSPFDAALAPSQGADQ